MGVFCVGWWISITVIALLRCIPMEGMWNPRRPAKCMNLSTMLVAGETPNSLSDFVIIALPLGVIQGLQLPLRHKLSIGFICVMVAL